MLFRLVLSQSSLRLPSCFLIFFSRSCSAWVFFPTTLSFSSLMRSSASSSLLLMLSIEFFIAMMSFFISSWFFFISSWFLHILLNLSSILFIHLMTISLNSFSDRFFASIASISFTSFSGDACFSFICRLFLCLPMISLLQVFGYVVLSLLFDLKAQNTALTGLAQWIERQPAD
uniref:Uncharacterized protein n=1 Tax=Myotis myotis TaxID=51298 RepID=A0A7J7WHU9_MYOMY|nr:hypothetical protein mMyoMyo1_012186 [Myotis myotis]